jgi:hypothetical protein
VQRDELQILGTRGWRRRAGETVGTGRTFEGDQGPEGIVASHMDGRKV